MFNSVGTRATRRRQGPLAGQHNTMTVGFGPSNVVINSTAILIGGINVGYGYTGSKGFTGSIGFTGSQGTTGFTGSIGSTGFTGSIGTTGTTGFTGSIGTTGTTGFTGSIGTTGTTGFTGSVGTTGFTGSSGSSTVALVYVFDGGGAVLTTGIKGDLSVPFACTITSARLLSDLSGNCVVDIWKDTYANYPPTVADTITASAKPTLSSATHSDDVTLTGWGAGKTVTAGDTIRFNIDSVAVCTRVTLILTATRS